MGPSAEGDLAVEAVVAPQAQPVTQERRCSSELPVADQLLEREALAARDAADWRDVPCDDRRALGELHVVAQDSSTAGERRGVPRQKDEMSLRTEPEAPELLHGASAPQERARALRGDHGSRAALEPHVDDEAVPIRQPEQRARKEGDGQPAPVNRPVVTAGVGRLRRRRSH